MSVMIEETDESIDGGKEPVVDPALAARMEMAVDNHPEAPKLRHGRIAWIRERLKGVGVNVSAQTVHRWYRGIARPRAKKMVALAQVLAVDDAWLAHGKEADIGRIGARRLILDGSQNIVIGYIQLAGGQCAFPDPEESDAEYTHFYAIIKGRQHRIHVSAADFGDGAKELRFNIPRQHERCTVIGVVQTGPLQVDLLHLSSDLIREHSEKSGSRISLTVTQKGDSYKAGGDMVDLIQNFSKDFRSSDIY